MRGFCPNRQAIAKLWRLRTIFREKQIHPQGCPQGTDPYERIDTCSVTANAIPFKSRKFVVLSGRDDKRQRLRVILEYRFHWQYIVTY